MINTELLAVEGQKAIAAKVGISAKILSESEVALMERGMAQNIMVVQSNLRIRYKYNLNNFRECIEPEKDVSFEEAK